MSGFTHTQLFWDHWAKLGGCTKSGLAHLPFAANSRIPVMYAAREGVELGGLLIRSKPARSLPRDRNLSGQRSRCAATLPGLGK
jgi:hypothetical protein